MSDHEVQMPNQLPLLGDRLFLFYYENEWAMITLYKTSCTTFYSAPNLYNCKPVQDLLVKYGVITVFDVDGSRHLIPIRGGNEDKLDKMIIQQYQAFDDYCLAHDIDREQVK